MGLIIFIFGLIIGSFLNVVIYRLPKGESVVYKPSHCVECETKLMARDLVPILSYLMLGGKCRYCNTKISLRYPVIEFITGVLFVVSYYFLDFNIGLVFYLGYVSLFLVITMIDLEHQIIPDELIIFGFIFGIFHKVINVVFLGISLDIVSSLIGFLIGGGVFLLIAVVSRGGMGGGDIKYMAMLGFLFGTVPIVIISILSFFIGAIVSILLIAFKIKKRKEYIPFGPFISIAAILTVLFKQEIIYWYLTNVIIR